MSRVRRPREEDSIGGNDRIGRVRTRVFQRVPHAERIDRQLEPVPERVRADLAGERQTADVRAPRGGDDV